MIANKSRIFKLWIVMLSFLLAFTSMPFQTLDQVAVANVTFNEVKLYYKNSSFSKANIHYKVDNGQWTKAPGRAMTPTGFPGFFEISIPLNGAAGLTAVFNNGANIWDNNKGKDYRFSQGIYTVENGSVRLGLPVQVKDITPPTSPEGLVASEISSTSAKLSWNESQDNLAVIGYKVFKNGTMIANQSATTFVDVNLAPETKYTYTVLAFDYTENQSVLSASVEVTTIQSNSAKVYYKANWSQAYLHYRPAGGTWTIAPGVKMQPSEVAGYYVADVTLGSANGLEAVFNNGAGTWDNNASRNYVLLSGTSTVADRNVSASAPTITPPTPEPPTPPTPEPPTPEPTKKVNLYYKSGYSNTFIHYRPEGGKWTTVPGVKMEQAEVAGFVKASIDIGTATRMEAVFNNGGSTWDNNNSKNYIVPAGDYTLSNGSLTAGLPIVTPITPIALSEISSVTHSPANGSITSVNDIVVNVQTKPVNAATKVEVLYSSDNGLTTQTLGLKKGAASSDADNWSVSVGKYPAKTKIIYSIKASDAVGVVLVKDNEGLKYEAIVEDQLVSTFPQMYLRGTNNGFDTSGKMKLIADYTWQINATFTGRMDDRFKFDVNGNWFRNFGDDNNDKIADAQARNDIYVKGGAGEYTITLNDRTMAYTISEPSTKVTSLQVDYPTYTLKVGETDYLSASVSPTNVANKEMTWTSSNSDIVEVVDGIVKAKAVGQADIVIASVDNPEVTGKTTVTVVESDLHPVYNDTNLNYVFDKTALPEITVEISTAEWNKLLNNFDANPQNEIEVSADYKFSKNGVIDQLTNIGLRLRGNTSRRRPEGTTGQLHNSSNPDWNHAHFAFKFSKFNKSQKFRGMSDLNTKWFKDDALHAREVYSYDLFKRYNVWTAPMSSYAKLKIKIKEDQSTAYFGVYEMIEAINQDYVDKRFPGNNTGNLWKGNNISHLNLGQADFVPNDLDERIGVEDPDNHVYVAYDLKTNKKSLATNGKPQLLQFIGNLNSPLRSETWLADTVDVDLFLRFMAVHVATGSWDDFWINGNNFYFYFDKAGKFYMIPYDYDNSLGTSSILADAGKQNPLKWGPLDSTSPLANEILKVPAYNEQYKAHLLNLIDPNQNLLDYRKSATRIQAWHKLIAPHVANDTGEDMEIRDVPASWGNAGFYRALSGDANTNFFRAKANSILASVLGTTVYYNSTAFSQAFIHYQESPGGAWTIVPGLQMDKTDQAGLFRIILPGAVHRAAFNNGAGVWDNNSGKDYSFGIGTWNVQNGKVSIVSP
jgi:spore coat protein H